MIRGALIILMRYNTGPLEALLLRKDQVFIIQFATASIYPIFPYFVLFIFKVMYFCIPHLTQYYKDTTL